MSLEKSAARLHAVSQQLKKLDVDLWESLYGQFQQQIRTLQYRMREQFIEVLPDHFVTALSVGFHCVIASSPDHQEITVMERMLLAASIDPQDILRIIDTHSLEIVQQTIRAMEEAIQKKMPPVPMKEQAADASSSRSA